MKDIFRKPLAGLSSGFRWQRPFRESSRIELQDSVTHSKIRITATNAWVIFLGVSLILGCTSPNKPSAAHSETNASTKECVAVQQSPPAPNEKVSDEGLTEAKQDSPHDVVESKSSVDPAITLPSDSIRHSLRKIDAILKLLGLYQKTKPECHRILRGDQTNQYSALTC